MLLFVSVRIYFFKGIYFDVWFVPKQLWQAQAGLGAARGPHLNLSCW